MIREIPTGDDTERSSNGADDAKNRHVFHGILRGEFCRYVSPKNGVSTSIEKGEDEHPWDKQTISDWRKDASLFEDGVGDS